MKVNRILLISGLVVLAAILAVIFQPERAVEDPQETGRPVTADSAEVTYTPAAPRVPDLSVSPPPAADDPQETAEITETPRSETAAETYDAAWAEARRSRMHALVRENPEQALAEALSPRRFAALPPEIQPLVERPLADEGFYGVLAICGHGPGEEHIEGACEIRHEVVVDFGTFDAEAFQASIYGSREARMTEESASLFGVIVDGHIALHEDDVVIIDDGEGFPGGRYAVYYRGQEWTTDDPDEARAIRARLSAE